MATINLVFISPWVPTPNPSGPQLVMISNESWTLSVIKGAPHQIINTTQKFVRIGVNVTHFGIFCASAIEFTPSGTKTVSFTYSGNVVSAMTFSFSNNPVTITLPDP